MLYPKRTENQTQNGCKWDLNKYWTSEKKNPRNSSCIGVTSTSRSSKKQKKNKIFLSDTIRRNTNTYDFWFNPTMWGSNKLNIDTSMKKRNKAKGWFPLMWRGNSYIQHPLWITKRFFDWASLKFNILITSLYRALSFSKGGGMSNNCRAGSETTR